jgi:hypothetical protein
MRCPRDKTKLVYTQNRFSLVCPRCDYKVYNPKKYWKPEMRFYIHIPLEFAWSTWTASNLDVTATSVGLTAGQVRGDIISPQMTNLTFDLDDQKRDITKVYIIPIQTKNDGRLNYYASNDGGDTWYPIPDERYVVKLPHGLEGDFGGPSQKYYNDLRIKAVLIRDNVGDSSPTLTSMDIAHNYVPTIT